MALYLRCGSLNFHRIAQIDSSSDSSSRHKHQMHCLTWGAAIIDWFEHSHDQFDASEYLHLGVMLNKYFCVFPFLHFYYLTQNSGHNGLELFVKQFSQRNSHICVFMRYFFNLSCSYFVKIQRRCSSRKNFNPLCHASCHWKTENSTVPFKLDCYQVKHEKICICM